MARRRVIDPEFWLDEKLSKVSPNARLLFIGLWGICDDNYATFPNRPEWIKVQVFPYSSVSTRGLLDELSTNGFIILFTHEDKEFYFIPNFFKYQKIDRPSKPKYAPFENTRRVLDESSTMARTEVKLSKEKGREVNTPFYKNIDYLLNIPVVDIPSLIKDTAASEEKARSKGEDLYNWCQSKGETREHYKMFLRNAIKKDYPSTKSDYKLTKTV